MNKNRSATAVLRDSLASLLKRNPHHADINRLASVIALRTGSTPTAVLAEVSR